MAPLPWLVVTNLLLITVILLTVLELPPSLTGLLPVGLQRPAARSAQSSASLAEKPSDAALLQSLMNSSVWNSTTISEQLEQYVDRAVEQRLKQLVPPTALPTTSQSDSSIPASLYRQQYHHPTIQLLHVHFTYTNIGPVEIPFLHFLAFYAANATFIRTNSSINGTVYEPVINIWRMANSSLHGPWWELTKQHCRVRERHIDAHLQTDTIFGQPVKVLAHISDSLRIQILLEHGGIYLDTDVVMLEPLPEAMWSGNGEYADVVMASQSYADSSSFCNAFIFASRPQTKFLSLWYERYSNEWDDDCWACNSLELPAWLAKQPSVQDSITVLPIRTFFAPDWSEANKIWSNDTYSGSVDLAPHYGLHLWHSNSWLWFKHPQTLRSFRDTNNLVWRLVERTLQPELLHQLMGDATLIDLQ